MKFKKVAALVVTAALALTGCGSDTGGSEVKFDEGTTMAKLAASGTITIGTKFDQPLFGLAGADGKPVGFDIEIGKLIAKKLGIAEDKIKWTETVSQNREPFIQNGQVDIVVATYTINDKRKEVIDFAGPYYEAGQALLVAKGNPKGITSPQTLGDNKVCTVTGSTSEKNIKEFTSNLLTVDKYSDCLEPILNGQAAALTTDNVILAGFVDKDPEKFEMAGEQFTKEPYGIGLKKGDEAFRTFINDTLEESFKDGSWEKAWKDTAGKVLPVPTPPTIDRYK